jgi:dipeptidase E
MSKKNLLIVSTSTVHGKPYLSYMTDEIKAHFNGVAEIVFIPFARPSGLTWDAYTEIARKYFSTLGIKVKGVHEFDDMKSGLLNAQGVFTGGGNTFVLLKQILDFDLMDSLKKKVNEGMPYMGTSAGSNLTGQTVNNTNDMPIVYPPTFEALGAIPFNINPHYLDPDPSSKHMGETRETRIKEYLVYNDIPVVGLREGSFLKVQGNVISLKGELPMRIFEKGKDPYEVNSGDDISFLMNYK